jgi:4-amino-4-deoxy-L-arabinose transferase-like glycosyltransferase
MTDQLQADRIGADDMFTTTWPPPTAPAGEAVPAAPPEPASEASEASDESPARPRWERPALAATLLGTAVLYLWGLGASGWANSFYSAAAQAGSSSWKAWLFGASDAAASITVDKPPASLWVMGLSVRIFGLSSWSILVPQALMGVGTVFLVWWAVRRWFGSGAAILAALVMAATPVAALMFRFNNPDALLVLLMTAAAITTLRGIEDGRLRWVVATGALVGFGFLTKQLQVLLIVPPLAAAHLVAGPGGVWRRVRDVLVAGAAMVAAAGWWIALVELWPASSRPYIGGSQTNSILELTFGYNGFGRLTGDEVGSVGGAPGGAGRWGRTGLGRLFDGVLGGQIAWLIPAALIALVAGLWVTRQAPRSDLRRAALIVWGGWLVVTALVFSFMEGIFHEYYTVALAPAIAALVGIGGALWWRHRHHLAARMIAAATVAVSAWWAIRLLDRAPDWNPWLGGLIAAGAVVAVALLLAGPLFAHAGWAVATAVVAGAVLLAGPTAWALETASTPHTGAIVTAGPAVRDAGRFGPGGGPGAFGPGGQGGGASLPGGAGGAFPVPGGPSTDGRGQTRRSAGGQGAFGGVPGGAPRNGQGGFGGSPGGQGGPGAGPGGGMGGLLDAAEPGDDLVAALLDGADDYTWVAATIGANNAAGYQLATERSVMPIGGFNGNDPSPTLAEFQQLVADGKIHYFIAGGGFGPGSGGSDGPASISSWVTASFGSVTIDGVTLYDLTQPTR